MSDIVVVIEEAPVQTVVIHEGPPAELTAEYIQYHDEAQAAAGTATEQAGIATGSAETATEQAGIATGAAATATEQAGIATGAAGEAAQSAIDAALNAIAVPGADGKTWYGGTDDPTTEGVDGDWYVQRTTWHVWENVSGTWTDRGSIKGEPGAAGAAGGDITTASELPIVDTAGKYTATDVEGALAEITPRGILVASLVWASNTVVLPTAVDLVTGVWTANGHGLVDNKDVCVFLRGMVIDFLAKYIPTGLPMTPNPYARVIDANTFYLVTTVNSTTPITYTANANMDLTKFQFEQSYLGLGLSLLISNLPLTQRCRVVISGRAAGIRYVQPVTDGENVPSSPNSEGEDAYGSINLGSGDCNLYLGGEVEIDTTDFISYLGKYKAVKPSTATANIASALTFRRQTHRIVRNVTFTSIRIRNGIIGNGTKIEVYAL